MKNAERIVLQYPNNTTVDIQGDPEIIEQLIEVLNKVEITYSKLGFSSLVR